MISSSKRPAEDEILKQENSKPEDTTHALLRPQVKDNAPRRITRFCLVEKGPGQSRSSGMSLPLILARRLVEDVLFAVDREDAVFEDAFPGIPHIR